MLQIGKERKRNKYNTEQQQQKTNLLPVNNDKENSFSMWKMRFATNK